MVIGTQTVRAPDSPDIHRDRGRWYKDEMYCCYILYSKSADRFYIGSTHDSLEERLIKHNTGYYRGKHYTQNTSDWSLHFSITCNFYSQARKIENHIKRMKSRKYLIDLKSHPEISDRLRIKYAD